MLHWLLVIQATAQNRCIQLPASTPCGSNFQNYPIFDINLEQLNDYVTNQVMDLNNVANALGTNGYCTQVSSLVNSLRYQITLYCASRVNIALQAGCLSPGNSTSTPACEKECNIAKDSFVNIIKNGSACPNGQALGGVAQAQSDVCSQAKLSKLKCVLSDSEVSTCGFKNEKIGREQCALLENDECCAEKFQLSGNKTNLIIGTAAVILGVITVALISYFVYLRRRRAKVEYPDSVPIENLLSAKPAVEYYDSNRELSHTPSIVDSGISKKSDSRITTDSAADYSNSEMIIDTFKSPISIDALPDSSYKIKVLHKYDAIMPDELNLVVGDVLYLAHSFKDGWAYGINANSKLQGVFPKVCVASILTVDTTKPVVGAAIESPVDDSFTKRLSSLNVIGPQRSSLQVHSNTISDERTRVPFNQYLAQLDEVEAEDTKNE